MRLKIIALFLVFVIGIGAFAGLFILQNGKGAFFNPGDRYQSQRLDYMGVIYTNQSDIYAFNDGYSETNSCPWGFIHNGIDYFFLNDSEVIAAAPGYVESVNWRLNPDTTLNMYNVFVTIRFNKTLELYYSFEPFTHVEGDQNRQIAMLCVQVGDWVSKGDTIGRFLCAENGGHIHFSVRHGNTWFNPESFFGSADHDEIMSLIHDYHPSWNLSYPNP